MIKYEVTLKPYEREFRVQNICNDLVNQLEEAKNYSDLTPAESDILHARLKMLEMACQYEDAKNKHVIEALSKLGDFVVGISGKVIFLVVAGMCLQFETTGGFTSLLSKALVGKSVLL